MGGRASILAVLLVAALLPASGLAADEGPSSVRVDVDRTIEGADTYMLVLRVQSGEDGLDTFEISPGSSFEVEGHFAGEGPASLPQDAAVVRGVVRYTSHLDCAPPDSDHPDPCFMDPYAESIKDARDAQVHAGAADFHQDPNASGWRSANTAISWDRPIHLEVPGPQDEMTIRIFASIPGAQSLDVDVTLRSPQSLETYEVVHAGGFVASGSDFVPQATLAGPAANAMAAGESAVDLDTPGNLLYAAFGPSWNGTTVVGPVEQDARGLGVSNLAYEPPASDTLGGTAVGIGSFSGFLIPGAIQKGTHSFRVNAHAGIGPQDIYLVGFKGPV